MSLQVLLFLFSANKFNYLFFTLIRLAFTKLFILFRSALLTIRIIIWVMNNAHTLLLTCNHIILVREFHMHSFTPRVSVRVDSLVWEGKRFTWHQQALVKVLSFQGYKIHPNISSESSLWAFITMIKCSRISRYSSSGSVASWWREDKLCYITLLVHIIMHSAGVNNCSWVNSYREWVVLKLELHISCPELTISCVLPIMS